MTLILSALLFLVGADRPGWFGLQFAYHPPSGAAQGYVLVENVKPQGPAAEAGLRHGDAIVAINHQPVSFADDVELLHFVTGFKPGQSVLMSVKRGNEDLVLNVVPAPMNDEQYAAYQQNLEKATHRRPAAPVRPR